MGLLPLLLHAQGSWGRAAALAAAGMILKGVVFPIVLTRILRDINVRREVEPFVGYGTSVMAGVGMLAFSMWLTRRLSLSAVPESALIMPAGFATVLIGLFLIVSRRKAVTQVLGYIVMENGIYAFGTALAGGVPLLVELGVLLDAFVAVFIMSIAIYHISREFDHIDVDQLDRLQG